MLSTVTAFDRTTAIRRQPGDGPRFAVELDESWSSLLGVHGGYVTALAVHAAESVAPTRAVRTVTSTFLRPTRPGPAELDVSVLRNGRSLTTIQVTTSQDERDAVATRITMTEPSITGQEWSTAVADRPVDRDRCIPFTPPPTIRHFKHAELLLDPTTIPTADIPTGGSTEARIAGHVRPIEARPIDAAWLTMIGDWFPPSPFRRVAPPIGGVSIDYTIHVHGTLPVDPERWLEGVFVAANSAGGIALERGTVADADGGLVAETFHTRWTG